MATTDSPVSAAAALPRRERLAILAAIAGVSALAWLYLWLLARAMPAMDGGMAAGGSAGGGGMATMAMQALPRRWSALDGLLMFVMWWVMMVGMMLPSATPLVLAFARVNRSRRARGQTYVPTALCAAGYLAAWGAFSLAATVAQWALNEVALLSAMMRTTDAWLGGGLFLAAGLYQFSPLKSACLHHCRSPFDLLLNRWRDGARGALAMGFGHGLYCLGCCWVLMALLFVGGVMNLAWVAALTVFVLIEKLAPAGGWLARAGGLAMLGFGAWLIAGAL